MEIKYRVTFIPGKDFDLNTLLGDVNKSFDDSFKVSGMFISTKDSIPNLDESNMNELKLFSKNKGVSFICIWFSDDISQGGMDFFDHEKNDTYSFSSNLGSKNIDPVSFMVFCGAGEYLSKVLF